MPLPASRRSSAQHGALSVFTALSIFVLLGAVGLAIDAGRIYTVHDEMQAAVDACALAGALELNGASDAPARAAAVGGYVGGRNKVNFQAGSAAIPVSGISFSATLGGTFVGVDAIQGSTARYIRCHLNISGVAVYFMSALGVGSQNLEATAVGAVAPSQAVCAIPMALCEGANTAQSSTFGYQAGEKATLADSQSSGFFTWADVIKSTAAAGLSSYEQAFISSGSCGAQTEPGRCIGIQTGVASSLDDGWNSRFGVYKQGGSGLDPALAIPDLSGYGYRDAASPLGGRLEDYETLRAPNRTPFQGSIPGYTVPPGVNSTYGAPYRRLTVMPVVQCSSTSCGNGSKPISGWACVLLLAPKKSSENAEIEFIGRAEDTNSPCRAPGTPGGGNSIGPLVPVLVQ